MDTYMDKKSILIVEDESSIAEVVALYLQRANFQTQHAQDGTRAMSLLSHQTPDLAILDLTLPEADGLSVIAWLRDRSERPAIISTSRRAEAYRSPGLQRGA